MTSIPSFRSPLPTLVTLTFILITLWITSPLSVCLFSPPSTILNTLTFLPTTNITFSTWSSPLLTAHLPHLALPPTALHQIISPSSPLSINPSPLPPPTLHSFRLFHRIDISSFLTDLKSSRLRTHSPKSLGSLFIAYNTSLSSLLDKHAPVVTKLILNMSCSNNKCAGDSFHSRKLLHFPRGQCSTSQS